MVASVSRSPVLNANGASPSGKPFRSMALTMPFSIEPVCARSTFTVSAPAALSAAASACATATPPETTVSGRLPILSVRPDTKAEPLPRSTPSDSQTMSRSGVAFKNRSITGSASARSTVCGFGLTCLICTRAAPATCIDRSRPVSDSGRIATPRPSASARASNSSALRSRASQVEAAAQPSSSRINSGAALLAVASGGFHNGPAAAMMTSAASVSRSKVSHHGVRDGVSSLGAISNNSRVGGKLIVRGRGGTSRSSHHRIGRLTRPISTSGCAKAKGSAPIMPRSLFARACAGC